MKIVSAEIGPMPRPMPEGMFDPMPSVHVTFEDGSSKRLFEFYPDELNFREGEFIGLDESEALDLCRKKDVEFLQSGSK